MSRTDKDRPYWVARVQDSNGIIEHDHRNGACIEETVETARAFSKGTFGRYGYHGRTCKKYYTVEWTCTKAEAYAAHKKDQFYPYGAYRNCWTTACDCRVSWREVHNRRFCEFAYRRQCVGHTIRKRDDSIPCVCDTWPDSPTCDFSDTARNGRPQFLYGSAPSWFVNQYFTRPERQRERLKLRDMVKEYNGEGDLEDDDFENRQTRSAAYWYWW